MKQEDRAELELIYWLETEGVRQLLDSGKVGLPPDCNNNNISNATNKCEHQILENKSWA